MKFTVLLGLLFLQAPLFASTASEWAHRNKGHCFEQHLREAVHVNSLRSKIYSRMSFGQSDDVLGLLVMLDRIGIPFGKSYDKESRKLMNEEELDIVCKFIPSFLPVLDKPIPELKIPTLPFKPFRVGPAYKKVKLAYKTGGLAGVKRIITQEISTLGAPQYNCMSRHFLKSMKRLIELAHADGRSQTEAFAWKLTHQTLLELRILTLLDGMAAPIQAQGLGIICNEIPEIP